jgi:hypothetical protein
MGHALQQQTTPANPPLAPAHTFTASDFTSSRMADADQKARFASHFTRFVAAGCPPHLFATWFHRHLRHAFGLPRHWTRQEMIARWFSSQDAVAAFIQRLLDYTPAGRAEGRIF